MPKQIKYRKSVELSGNLKKIVAVIIGVIVILMMLGFVLFMSVRRYIDTHTWATIRVVEAIDAETNDVYNDSREYLKGDEIPLKSGTLLIEGITHEGTVEISSSDGVADSNTGKEVHQFTIRCGESYSFKEEKGVVTVYVVSNRYE